MKKVAFLFGYRNQKKEKINGKQIIYLGGRTRLLSQGQADL